MCKFLRGITCATGCKWSPSKPAAVSPNWSGCIVWKACNRNCRSSLVQFSVFFWLHGPDLQTLDTDDDASEVFELHVFKAQKISANAGHPKAGDYNAVTKELEIKSPVHRTGKKPDWDQTGPEKTWLSVAIWPFHKKENRKKPMKLNRFE